MEGAGSELALRPHCIRVVQRQTSWDPNRPNLDSLRSKKAANVDGKTGDRPSRCVAIVIVKQTAQSLTALNIAGRCANFLPCFEDGVVQALMISFLVIMKKVLANSAAQRFLSEKDHLHETLGFDTSHKSLDVGVQIRALWRKPYRFGTLIFSISRTAGQNLPSRSISR